MWQTTTVDSFVQSSKQHSKSTTNANPGIRIAKNEVLSNEEVLQNTILKNTILKKTILKSILLSQFFFGLFFLFCFEPSSTVPSPHSLVGDFVVLAMGAHNRPSGCQKHD